MQRENKKLDQKHIKFTVTGVIGSYNYRLDMPPGIYNIFYTKLLRPAAIDPFDSQVTDNAQPEGIEINRYRKQGVKEIRKKRTKR